MSILKSAWKGVKYPLLYCLGLLIAYAIDNQPQWWDWTVGSIVIAGYDMIKHGQDAVKLP